MSAATEARQQIATVPGSEFGCEFCGGHCALVDGSDESALALIHSVPVCSTFLELDADDFLSVSLKVASAVLDGFLRRGAPN